VTDHLDELHARHRIKKMNADEPLRPWQSFAQLFERNTRRVGGEDCVGLHFRLDAGEDFPLELENFRHRLDDEIRRSHSLTLEVGDQTVDRVADPASIIPADYTVEISARAHAHKEATFERD
jgi:hypothetical protein